MDETDELSEDIKKLEERKAHLEEVKESYRLADKALSKTVLRKLPKYRSLVAKTN